jgi:hypothetical protein
MQVLAGSSTRASSAPHPALKSLKATVGAGVLACRLLCDSAAFAAPAAAPVPDPAATPGTVCRLTIFNDSLNLGIGVVASLFGYDEMDGNDEGFTHGMELAVERLSATGTTGTWALGSRLYTRRVTDESDSDSRSDVPLWFTEEESLSYIADTRRADERSFLEYGAGLLYDSKTFTSVGATGQQDWFHENVNTSNQTTYRYLDDGQSAWGVFVHAGYGRQATWRIGAAGTAVAAHARLAIEPCTLTDASQLILGGAASLSSATLKAKISATIAFEAVLHPEGLGYAPSVELAYERRGWGIRSNVAFPGGEARNHVRYNDDTDPISALSLFIRFAE